MIIELNADKINALENVIKSHDFEVYLNYTNKFRGFEVPNLDNEVKMSLLQRLSTANWREVPAFIPFWNWFRTKHGMHIAQQICVFMFPTDTKMSQKMVNCMRNNKNHDWWDHIKARVYKKWCSILTEMQAVYAVVKGSEKLELKWKVLASAALDAAGVDFVIIADKHAYPVQIKKDSFIRQAAHKQNNKENLSRFETNKKATKIIAEELEKAKIKVELESGLLLKYGLPNKNMPAYHYLKHFDNRFVYFDHIKLVKSLIEVLIPTKNLFII